MRVRFSRSESDVAAMTFFADDSMLALAGGFESRTLKLSGGNGKSDSDSQLPTTGTTTAGQFSPDRTMLVVPNQSQSVQLIELETKSLIRTVHAPYFVHGIAISGDNQLTRQADPTLG